MTLFGNKYIFLGLRVIQVRLRKHGFGKKNSMDFQLNNKKTSV